VKRRRELKIMNVATCTYVTIKTLEDVFGPNLPTPEQLETGELDGAYVAPWLKEIIHVWQLEALVANAEPLEDVALAFRAPGNHISGFSACERSTSESAWQVVVFAPCLMHEDV
jgi:hypothetical protein